MAPVGAMAQQKWYVRAEGGPMLSVSYSTKSGYYSTGSDLRHQYGVSGGMRLGTDSYFSLETGLSRQSHSVIATLRDADGAGQYRHVVEEYSVLKVPVRVTADLLPQHSKVGFQFVGGLCYLFKPGRKAVGEQVPANVSQLVIDEETGRSATVTSKYFLDGAWGIETGLRASYKITDHFAAELAGVVQAGLSHMATTTITHNQPGTTIPVAESISRGEAVSLLLSVRYSF